MTAKTKAIIAAVGCGLILFLSWAGLRACRQSSGYSKLAGENIMLKAEVAKIKAQAEKDRAISNALIAAKNASILEHQKKEAALAQQVATGDSNLTKLKANFSLIKDCPGQVLNLQAQIANLEQTKADQGKYIVEIRGERDDWQGKFDAQVTISETWKKQYVAEVALNTNLEAMNGQLRTDLWWAKFGSNLKIGVIVVEAGIFTYLYLRK